MIGYAVCGSFCTLSDSLAAMKKLADLGYELQPIMSEHAYDTDTRFYEKEKLRSKIREIAGRSIIHTIKDAEVLGPSAPLSALIIAPCTGNTLAKLSNGICDTPVTLAAKAHLRNDRPLVIALASNDSLAGNAENFGRMLARRNVYFVPLRQDDAMKKPRSLVCEFALLQDTVERAVKGIQMQPILL